jgi:hypothetical protein
MRRLIAFIISLMIPLGYGWMLMEHANDSATVVYAILYGGMAVHGLTMWRLMRWVENDDGRKL